MVVEGIHVEDIFEFVSLVLSLIISWTFRILAHEENQYTDFLSIALKQAKAGPRSSGTPFVVFNWHDHLSLHNRLSLGTTQFVVQEDDQGCLKKA